MEEKIKEMKRDAKKKAMGGIQGGAGGNFARGGAALGSGIGSGASYKTPAASSDFASASSLLDSYTAAAAGKGAVPAGGGGKAMKLGKKTATTDMFVEQLRQEGQVVQSADSAVSVGVCAA